MSKQETIIDGIRINPVKPDCFHRMAIEDMPDDVIEEWMNVPYIIENGSKYIVYCLDYGAWDRPTMRAHFDNLNDAIAWIKSK